MWLLLQSIPSNLCTLLYKFSQRKNSPLSQELLNSVRRAKSELRRTTGSEPKKLIDVAEYRSFPVGEEEDMRENSWKSFIHIHFEQYLIYLLMYWTISVCLSSELSEQVALTKILGNICNAFLCEQGLCLVKSAHSCDFFFLLQVHFRRSAGFF